MPAARPANVKTACCPTRPSFVSNSASGESFPRWRWNPCRCNACTATTLVDKCRFCEVSNYVAGMNKTTCVSACPTKARVFGDLDDPNCELVRAIVEKGAQPISGTLTQAKVFYVR